MAPTVKESTAGSPESSSFDGSELAEKQFLGNGAKTLQNKQTASIRFVFSVCSATAGSEGRRAALSRFEFSEILAKSVEIHVFLASQLRKLSFFVLDARVPMQPFSFSPSEHFSCPLVSFSVEFRHRQHRSGSEWLRMASEWPRRKRCKNVTKQ